jgi:cell division septation protein DedD
LFKPFKRREGPVADRDKKNSSDEKPYGDSVELFEGMFKDGLEKMKGIETRTPAAEVEDAAEKEKRETSPKKPFIEAKEKPPKPKEKPVIRDKKQALKAEKRPAETKRKPEPRDRRPDLDIRKKPLKPKEKPATQDKKQALEAKKKPEKPGHSPAPREKKPITKAKTKTARPKEDKPAIRKKVTTPPKKDIPSGKDKKGKGSSVLKVILLAVFIILLGGVAMNYLGVVDLAKLAGISGPIEKPVTQPKVEKKLPDSPATNEATVTVKESPVQEKPVKVEKVEESLRVEQPVEEKLPEKEVVAVTSAPAEATPPIKKSSIKEKLALLEKPIEEKIPEKKEPPPTERVSYPYSILLGAFSNMDRAADAVSRYKKEGLSSFYVKVDLGKKGIWFRIFTGHFQGKKEAADFISRKGFKGASIKRTRYAALIGSFSNKEDLNEKQLMLSGLGYTPYVIDDTNGWSYLFIGAFYTKIGAELQQQELATKGIQSTAVER